MAKRLMLVAALVGALGVVSLVNPSTAEARHGCYRGGYGGYSYGGPVYHSNFYRGGFHAPYRSSYYYGGPSYYGGPGYYGGGGFYYGGHRGGLYIGF